MTTSAGWRSVHVTDHETGTTFPAVVAYPSAAPERVERIGPYEVQVAMDGPVAAGAFPLVAVSHGSGGSPLTHRGLIAYLARRGFVVVAPEHAGNNRGDDSLQGTAANLAHRPRHLGLAIDRTRAEPEIAASLVPDAVAIVGHSLGGYTALALAGGRPTAFAHETGGGRPASVPVTPDPSVRALALLAPATPWLMAPGALADVRVPILMLTGERDTLTPAGHAEIVKRGVPDAGVVAHRVVPDAGHYAFLAPFPTAMTAPTFAPSQDPPGFDRARFHDEMYAEIEGFVRDALVLRPETSTAR